MNALANSPKWAPSNKSGAGLTFRLALRELRGGLRGFYIFIACIALGVMAIAAGWLPPNRPPQGLAPAGRVILRGDVAVLLLLTGAPPARQALLSPPAEVCGVA